MNPDENTTDDVRAAITSLETGAPPVSETQAPAPAPAAAPVPSDSATQQRDASGRFVAKEDAAAVPAPPAAAPAAPVASAPAVAKDGVQAPPAPTDAERGVVALDPTKPPQGWTQGMKEKWASIPDDVRQEITRRESDMAAGVQRLNQQFEPLRQIGSALQPYETYFQHIQRPPTEYLNELIPIEQTLALGNPAQKLDMLLNVADRYGVPLRAVLDQAMGGQLKQTIEASHQQFGTPTPLPPQVQQELNSLRQQLDGITNTAAKNELDAFIADTAAHPFFEQVRDGMAELLEKGSVSTYQEAYDICVWRNPEMRAAAVAQANGQAQAAGLQQRQQAAAVAVPPSGASLAQPTQATAGDGDVYDDVKRAWAAVANGART